jgi:3-oxoacyl-[acyl-carrier-protein] synthase-3
MKRSRILGTGSGAPARVVTNKDFEAKMDTSDEWIVKRTGISERRMALPSEKWSDFILPACEAALESSGVRADELDMIIVGTLSADTIMPSGGCVLQSLLGATKATAFDLAAACSGFIYGLVIADRFIRLQPDLKILVVGGELISTRIDWGNRNVAPLFGDGGGAVVVGGSDSPARGILATHTASNGDLGKLLYIPGGGTQNPRTNDEYDQIQESIHMDGRAIFKEAIIAMESACAKVLLEAGYTAKDVDVVIPHQANIRIIEALVERLDATNAEVIVNIDRYGNTSAGTIPLALDEAVRDKRLKEGDLLLMTTFGGGLTWGAVLMRW